MKRYIILAIIALFCLCDTGITAEKYHPYGLNEWFVSIPMLNYFNKAHIYHYRIYLPWFRLEPEEGNFTGFRGSVLADRSSDTDMHLNQFKAAQRNAEEKIRLSLICYDSPDWARKDPKKVLSFDPEKFARFVVESLKYCEKVAPGMVEAVEIQNEEPTGSWLGDLLPAYGTDQRDASQYYAQILKASYKAVKAYNPKILVIMSGIWGNEYHHLEDLYQLGCKDYFDRINLHYYDLSNYHDMGTDPLPPDEMKNTIYHLPTVMGYLKHIAVDNGDGDKPIWVTEFAWGIMTTEKKKADYLEKALDIFRKTGFVERIDYYRGYGERPFDENGDFGDCIPLGLLYVDSVLGRGASEEEKMEYRQQPISYETTEAYFRFKEFAEKYPVWDKKERLEFMPAASKDAGIVNSGFESGNSGWKGSLSIDTKDKRSGNSSMKINAEGEAESDSFVVEPLKLYELTFWIKINGEQMDGIICMPSLMFHNSLTQEPKDSGRYGIWGLVDTRNYPNGWRKYRTFVVPPEDADACQLKFEIKGKGEAFIDDISLKSLDLDYLNK